MTKYEIYSLAIQALHERRAWLQRINSFRINSFPDSLYPGAIKECEEAIECLELKLPRLPKPNTCRIPMKTEPAP